MKKILFLMLGMAAMLASCSQSEELPSVDNDAKQVTFSLSAGNRAQTRASIGSAAMRYVLAIYDENGTGVVKPVTIFDTGTFSVRIDPGKYTCLFWADYGSENYDVSDLRSVALQDGATNVEAFFARQDITVTTGGPVNVTLDRAVAKVVLKETDRLEAGSIAVTCDGYKGFDVYAGAGINPTAFTHTFPIPSVITGSVAAPTEVGSFLLLANPSERELGNLKVKYNNEAEKTISNVPVQANYVTNICGKFSINVGLQFTISINDTWASPDKEVDLTPYVTFSAASEQTFKMDFFPNWGIISGIVQGASQEFVLETGEYFEYAVGRGDWTRFTTTVEDIHFGGTLGDLRLRGKSSKGTAVSDDCFSQILFGASGVRVDCTGDIRTLVDYQDYRAANTSQARFAALFHDCVPLATAPSLPAMILADQCYSVMFFGCTSLTAAPALPATTLAEQCYMGMFRGCTSLTAAPALPAPALTERCYLGMFYGCTSLTSAPALPATTLAKLCYTMMFDGCTSLASAPALPARTLAEGCYSSMFSGCTSLASAPALPAPALTKGCYGSMFSGCTSLASAPALPAPALAQGCYSNMFYGCTALTAAPELPATTLKKDCYVGMFYGCTALTAAPELPATTLEENCYTTMFSGCTNLSEVKMLATNVSATNCLADWLVNAGTGASTRTLTLYSLAAYTAVKSTLPANWQQEQATIQYANP